MDQLVLAAASALVAAMATNGWEEVRAGAGALWRRVHPDRAPAIESELEEMRNELLASRRVGDAEVETELVIEWRRKLRRLMAAHPELAAELQRLLQDEWSPLVSSSEGAPIQNIRQVAVVSGDGRVSQAGGNQYIIGT